MVSRPSPAASRSTLATLSRSASEGRRLRGSRAAGEGSSSAGELLIAAKPRRTRARRYRALLVATGTLCRVRVRNSGARAGKLRLGLGQHPGDVPPEADVAGMVAAALG